MKHKRKVARLEARQKEFDEMPVAERKGFRRAGSLSKRGK